MPVTAAMATNVNATRHTFGTAAWWPYRIGCRPSTMDTRKNLIAKHFGLRGIAVFEAFKGLLAIMVAIWLLSLLHKDLQNVAEHLLRFLHKLFHLNPDGHLARSIVRGARHVTPGNLHLWIGGSPADSAIPFFWVWGGWLGKTLGAWCLPV